LIGGGGRRAYVAVLIGDRGGQLGQAALVSEVFGGAEGDAPPVDLEAEKRNGDFIRANRENIKACTDLSDGGLALAAFELAESAGVGVWLDMDDTPTLFGEDQGRYLVACNFDQAEALMVAAGLAGVPIQTVGKFTGTDVWFASSSSAPLSELSDIYRTSFAAAVA